LYGFHSFFNFENQIEMSYKSFNPFTGTIQKKFKVITDTKLDSKLEKAQNSALEWKHTSLEERGKLMNKLADLLKERKDTYGQIITEEMGKPITQSTGEVEKCSWVCRYYAENAFDFLKDRELESTALHSHISYDPLGVIFAVMPWNFPFWQVFRFIAPTLMAGNVGLLKHASNVPRCAVAIEEVLHDAGFPEGTFQNLFIDYRQIELVIASPVTKAITLTGSNIAGSTVAGLAGKYLKKTILELGGSDPFIVFNDADINLALEYAMLSRFLNAGQSCIAAKRFIIHDEIAEKFVSNLNSLVEQLIVGDPMDPKTYIGTMVSEKAVNEIARQVKESIEMGAECIIGGHKKDHLPTQYLPTILINVPDDAPAWTEELFGPVATIRFFHHDSEALILANNTPFGLGASVWTTNMERASFFSRNIESGTVAINGMVKSEPGLPFGGIKESGYGRELSDYGIYEFVNVKTVSYF